MACWPRLPAAERFNVMSLTGEAIGNSESIRRAHNSFAPPEPIVSDESRATEKDGQHATACPHVCLILTWSAMRELAR